MQEPTFDGKLVATIFQRGLARAITPELAPQLEALGLPLRAKPMPAVARARVMSALALVAHARKPDLEEGDAHRALGVELVQGLASGWRMRALRTAARAAGLVRTLQRLEGEHRVSSSFMRVTVHQTDPGVYALSANLGAPHPELLTGMVEQILRELGARDFTVTLLERGERERIEVRLAR